MSQPCRQGSFNAAPLKSACPSSITIPTMRLLHYRIVDQEWLVVIQVMVLGIIKQIL